MASTTTSTRLLALPRELRDFIYLYTFDTDQDLVVTFPDILRANKQLRREAIKPFHKYTTFFINYRNKNSRFGPDFSHSPLLAWIRRTPKDLLDLVPSIVVKCNFDYRLANDVLEIIRGNAVYRALVDCFEGIGVEVPVGVLKVEVYYMGRRGTGTF